jgi:hypothetical protein
MPEETRSEDAVTFRAPGRSVAAPGKSSAGLESSADFVFSLFNSVAPLSYMLSWEVLDYVEIIARWNPDFSQAVDNIKTLSNSGHNLFVDHSSSNKAEKIKERLTEKARTIQEPHGGIDGLISKLLDQAATFGAMCGEWIVNEELTDVIDFIDVNPKTIRYFWEDDHWAPYQKVTRAQAEEAKAKGQKIRNGDCVKLNELTFHYYAFDAAPGSPYGTPPFIAALQGIGIQNDMISNMAKIVKKVSLLGMVDIKIERLQPKRNESGDEYMTRASAFLDEYAKAIQDMMDGGGLAHFDDAEVVGKPMTGNAAGATAIFKQNEELIFSGLKSMPSVQGRSYSTTETYAGVAYDIIIRNTQKFQRAAKRMIESGYWLMVTLWGETPKSISIEFNPNKSLHRLQDAQALVLEIKTALMLWATGIIDQQGFAQLLGYSSVKTEFSEPPETPLIGNSSPGGGTADSNTSTDTGNETGQLPPRSDSRAQEASEIMSFLAKEFPQIFDGSLELPSP